MKERLFSSLLATALTISATSAAAQATADTANIPQPHFVAARALAAQENSWRHPALVTCYPHDGQASQNVNMNPPGFKVFDNLYYVGDGKYGPYAVNTSAGIILIDAMNNTGDVEHVIFPNMRNVGLDPAQIKVLIISHGHGDHYGGSQDVIQKYHPRIYMSAADYDFAVKDYAAKLAAGNPQHYGPPPARDRIVMDGGTVTLGNETIKTYITPGHTPGSLAMLIPVKDHGSPKLLAYYGGVTPPATPAMEDAFTRSFTRMAAVIAQAKPDGFIAAHPNYDDAVFNIQKMRANPNIPNPFLIGTADIVRYSKIITECNLNNAFLRQKVPGWPHTHGHKAP